MFPKISQVLTQNLFQICACVISARKAKHFDVTIMFTYSHANTPLGLSESAYYLSYFIIKHIDLYRFPALKFQNKFQKCEVVNKYSHKIYFISHKHPIHNQYSKYSQLISIDFFSLYVFFPFQTTEDCFFQTSSTCVCAHNL